MINIAMVVYSHYPTDPRVRREAEALVEAGMAVDVISLVRRSGEETKTRVNGVNVYRIQLKRKRAGKIRYFLQYGYFIVAACLKLSWLHLSRRYDIVHVHNMPDILVSTALFPKMTGSKIILDLHDPMPELYMTIYSMGASHPLVKVLLALEKLSIAFADRVITPNTAFRDLFVSRSCPPWKLHIVMNSPQETIFHKREIKAKNSEDSDRRDKFDLMYHGLIVERHGLDDAIEAASLIKDQIPNLIFHIYGEGEFLEDLKEKVKRLAVSDWVEFYGFVPLERIAAAISDIDLGIVPNKMSPFTNINFPTRIFEYLSVEKPVVIPRTKGVCDYFSEDSIYFFNPGDVNSLARTILKVYEDPQGCLKMVQRGISIYHQHRWELQKDHLVNLVLDLLGILQTPAGSTHGNNIQEFHKIPGP
ncbi:MAG: glycosyltransferase family 4 protein [Deltaproteobacteria bacterium]|nr:glycosyltransferase family 4 protein [Deltaproteobacteria bacterium]